MVVGVADVGDTGMTLENWVCFASVLYIVWEEVVLREFIVKIVPLLKDADMLLTESELSATYIQTPSTVVMFLIILALKQFDWLHPSHVPDSSVSFWHPMISHVPQKMHDSVETRQFSHVAVS